VEAGEDAKAAKPLPSMLHGFYPPGTPGGGARSEFVEDPREETKVESIESNDSVEIRLRNVRQLTDRGMNDDANKKPNKAEGSSDESETEAGLTTEGATNRNRVKDDSKQNEDEEAAFIGERPTDRGQKGYEIIATKGDSDEQTMLKNQLQQDKDCKDDPYKDKEDNYKVLRPRNVP